MNTEYGGQSLPTFGGGLRTTPRTPLPRLPREHRAGLGTRLRTWVHPRTS
jgi:hypothetical protein